MARPWFIGHHTAGPENQTVESIRRFHVDIRRWNDIGYNKLIRNSDGRIYEGRGWDVTGAHAPGYNSISNGVAIIGTFSDKLPSTKALESFLHLYSEAQDRHGSVQMVGHQDVTNTTCPGGRFYNWIHSDRSTIPTNEYEMDDEMYIDLRHGDQGTRTKSFQLCLYYAGFDLGTWGDGKNGIDGIFGDDTQKAYYAARKSVGSEVSYSDCSRVSAWGDIQVKKAFSLHN